MQTLRNISDFENVPRRGWLLVGNGLESNEANGDAGVHMGFDYRIYSIQGGLSHNTCKRVWYSLQLFDVSVVYTIEKLFAVVNTA